MQSVPTHRPLERLRSCPQPQLRGNGRLDLRTCWWDGWRVEEAQDNSLPPPPPILPRFVGVVLLELTAPGLRTVAEPAISGWTGVVGTLIFCPSLGGPRHPFALSDRGLCHSGTSGIGAAEADGEGSGAGLLREGLLEPGAREGRGSGVSSLRLFVQSRDFLSVPPYYAKPAPLEPAAVVGPGAFHRAEVPFPAASGGAGPRDTAAPGGFLFVKRQGSWGWLV